MSESKMLKIKAKLETSNHCGYCTGEECRYKVKKKYYYVDIPDDKKWMKELKIGTKFKISDYHWESLLPIPDVFRGFWTCSCTDEVVKSGLSVHDYRYTILSVYIVAKNH